MKKTPVLKALTHYSLKIIISNSLTTTVKFSFHSFLCACVCVFVRSFIPLESMSVNYLEILLDKFMVFVISMDSVTCQYVGCHKKTYTVL